MASKGGEGGYGEGDNVHSGSGSKSGKTEGGYKLPKGKAEGNAVGGKDTEFAEGGHSNHMFGEQNADEQKAGGTAHDNGGGGEGDKFAAGGSTKMFGYAGSVPARAGITSAR
jgi:hypothetical protein